MFFPGVQKAQAKYEEEDEYFNNTCNRGIFHDHRPGENEDCFHVEDEEEDGEEVVSYRILQPCAADGFDTAFIRFEFLGIDRFRGDEWGEQDCSFYKHYGYDKEEDEGLTFHKLFCFNMKVKKSWANLLKSENDYMEKYR